MIKNVLLGLALCLGAGSLVIAIANKEKKTVYVEVGKLYSDFKLTKELNVEYEGVLKMRKRILDSLEANYYSQTHAIKQKKSRSIEDIALLAKLEESYYSKKSQFETENSATNANYNDKVWAQLNQYLQDFGHENNYDLILGATGQGNIMFAKKDYDVTNDVIEYANKRYEGNNK